MLNAHIIVKWLFTCLQCRQLALLLLLLLLLLPPLCWMLCLHWSRQALLEKLQEGEPTLEDLALLETML
jgi:hypothetical protein